MEELSNKKVSEIFDDFDNISKHIDESYLNVDLTILDFSRMIEWIEEDILNEEYKYVFNEENKESEFVEVIKYNQKQVIEKIRIKLINDLKEYLLGLNVIEDIDAE